MTVLDLQALPIGSSVFVRSPYGDRGGYTWTGELRKKGTCAKGKLVRSDGQECWNAVGAIQRVIQNGPTIDATEAT